ncbi:MAG: sulfotransferase [Candidatus Marinimicrobia bacterium]|nr:sulfotransferase [Candidatus Neomarinimicrobiota bacterium]MCF7828552.1 sulfotransferase [Candidatus Neomarinimicrobiota bacterium]MCF7880293.1 sulfotransferase [Candidatus Neomarinimicrobiota bacterium]
MDTGVIPNPTIVFIGGSGRSGTNITKEILGQHPDVATLPFEYRFIIDPNGLIDFYNSVNASWSPYFIDSKIKQLEYFLLTLATKSSDKTILSRRKPFIKTRSAEHWYKEWELEKWIPDYTRFVNQLISELSDFTYSAKWPGLPESHPEEKMYFSAKRGTELRGILGRFIYRCVNAILSDQNKSVFVEDNTWNILFAKELLELCPSGKILHVMRDPRDVVASLRQQRWTPGNLLAVLRWYKGVMTRWEHVKSSLGETQFIEIKFEALVQNTEPILKELCSFIHLSFQEVLLDISLDKAHIHRWQSDFTEEEKVIIEKELKSQVQKYGYHFK